MDAERKATKQRLKEMQELADYERLLSTAKLFPEERRILDLVYLEGLHPLAGVRPLKYGLFHGQEPAQKRTGKAAKIPLLGGLYRIEKGLQ